MKTIYYNGAVYTGTLPLAEAFAVENGRFLFAGTNEEAKALAADNDRLIELWECPPFRPFIGTYRKP